MLLNNISSFIKIELPKRDNTMKMEYILLEGLGVMSFSDEKIINVAEKGKSTNFQEKEI